MRNTIRNAALVMGMLAAGTSYAVAQAGPVDSKGQGGGTVNRGVTEPSGSKDGNIASGNYAPRGTVAEEMDKNSGATSNGRSEAPRSSTGGSDTSGAAERR